MGAVPLIILALLFGVAIQQAIKKRHKPVYSVYEIDECYYISRVTGNKTHWLSQMPYKCYPKALYREIHECDKPEVKFTDKAASAKSINVLVPITGHTVLDYVFPDYPKDKWGNILGNPDFSAVNKQCNYMYACLLVDIFSGVYKQKLNVEEAKKKAKHQEKIDEAHSKFSRAVYNTPAAYSSNNYSSTEIKVSKDKYKDEVLRLTPLIIEADKQHDTEALDKLLVEFERLKT